MNFSLLFIKFSNQGVYLDVDLVEKAVFKILLLYILPKKKQKKNWFLRCIIHKTYLHKDTYEIHPQLPTLCGSSPLVNTTLIFSNVEVQTVGKGIRTPEWDESAVVKV